MKANYQLINQDSGNYEWYTPLPIIEAVRVVMGSIDLDPASSESANRFVEAKTIFTEADDGLSKKWFGNVWMNHPFSRTNNPLWINKLLNEYVNGGVDQACCICYAATSERWFRDLMDFPQCFLYPRTNYYLPDGSVKRGVTKGSVVTYLGQNVDKFNKVFDGVFGKVKI